VTRYRVLYWQQIPSLVKELLDDGETVSHPLPDWFQQEIDRQAMEQGLTGSDAYLEAWNWGEPQEQPARPEEIVAALVAGWPVP
jgi:hypothetical protein